MKSCRINNAWVNDGMAMATQIVLIFAFLTVFFFIYVIKVEKDEFKKQLDLIVDNMAEDTIKDLPNLIKQSKFSKEDANIIINGILAVVEEKIAIDSKESVQEVLTKNNAVKSKAFKSLSTLASILIIASLILLVVGFCVSIKQNIKEAIIVVFFIGLTEFTFLTVIASKYISADPNAVRRELGKAIQQWIEKNHPDALN